ncbi:MAG: RNA polymerase sigma factor [Phycisphaeraceae bacterium JB051]
MRTNQLDSLGAGDPDDPQEQLLTQVAAGNAVAFEQLVHLHADRLYALAYVMLKNRADAEDAVQETFLAVFESASKFQGNATVKTWITRILIKRIARIRRKSKWGKLLFVSREPVMDAMPASNRTEDTQIQIDTMQAIAQLPPEFSSVVMLREIQGFSYAQIADVLNLPRGTVESRLHRGRALLKDKLADYFHPPPQQANKPPDESDKPESALDNQMQTDSDKGVT